MIKLFKQAVSVLLTLALLLTTFSGTVFASGNSAPTLKSGVSAIVSTSFTAGTGSYNPGLTSKFEDADGDTLTYWYSKDGGEFTEIEAAGLFSGPAYFEISSAAAGTFTYVFKVTDGKAFSADTYTVNVTALDPATYTLTLKLAPSTIDVKLYPTTGFDANGYDTFDAASEIAKGESTIESSYKVYTIPNLTAGTYSYRGTDADGNDLGGMTFDVPVSTTGGTNPNESTVILRQNEFYARTKLDGTNYANGDQYGVRATDADGKYVTVGSGYQNGNYFRYRSLLYAGGNAELYTYYFYPKGDYALSYGTQMLINQTIAGGTSVLTKNTTLAELIDYSITAPTAATVKVFNQIRNFWVDEISPASTTDNQNGTKTVNFRLPKSSANHTYRVSMDGKITKAGYLSLSEAGRMSITFGADENPSVRPEYDITTTIGSRLEDSVLLNVSEDNSKSLAVDETFRLRAYRAAWEIINSDTANIMIEPDFHYEVVSGADIISITPVNGGNATGNWLDLKALKSGTAVLKITYDAIEIGGNTNYGGIYGASDPERYGLCVITVGETADVEWNIEKVGEGSWDSEFDTVYFLGDSGSITLAPTSTETITSVKMNGTEIVGSGGKYTAAVLPGANILEITAGGKKAYKTVRGAKVSYTIEKDGDPTVNGYNVGDTVKITFDGLYLPVPKMSGLYNPGFGGTQKLTYSMTIDGENETAVQGAGRQYDFITKHTITMTLDEAGAYALKNGHLPMTMMGTASPIEGGHRSLTDTGVGANFSAVSTKWDFNVFPNIEFTVNPQLFYTITITGLPTDAVFSLTNSSGTAIAPDSGTTNTYTLPYGSYPLTATASGYKPLRTTIDVSSTNGSRSIPLSMTALSASGWDGESYVQPSKDGSGVYHITKGAELAWLANEVNTIGNGAVSAILDADIDLSGCDWKPIGSSSKPFAGTFDGNGKKVYGLYINAASAYQALFGYIDGAAVKNLTVEGEVKNANTYTAGIIAYSKGASIIENCHNKATVTANGNKDYFAGVLAYVWGEPQISGCTNEGAVSGYRYVGGIIGYAYNSTISISNCSNSAGILGTGQYIGGVVGYSKAGIVSGCNNGGNVSGTGNIGGIIGYAVPENTAAEYSIAVSRCSNSGNVTVGQYGSAGGIVGYAQSKSADTKVTVSESKNAGVIGGSATPCGGIVGKSEGSVIANCYNTAEVGCTATSGAVGGIVGSSFANSSNYSGAFVGGCYNIGTITGKAEKIGAIIGSNVGSASVAGKVDTSVYLVGTAESGIGDYSSGKVNAFDNASMTNGNAAFELYMGGYDFTHDAAMINGGYPILLSSCADAISAAKVGANIWLDNYKSADSYREAEKTARENAISTAKSTISSAADRESIISAVVTAKDAIDLLKTDEQYCTEELPSVKEALKTELNGYVNAADYRAAQQTELSSAVANGLAAIDAATARAEAELALSTAKGIIDLIKTDAALLEEEARADLEATKTTALAEIEAYPVMANYRDAEKLLINTAVSDGRTVINTATDINAVYTALSAAKIVINGIKTDAQYRAEEAAALSSARVSAIAELEAYKSAELYREAQKQLLYLEIESGKAAINSAEASEIETALNNAKAAIDLIKTNEQLTAEESGASAELAAAKTAAISVLDAEFATAVNKTMGASKKTATELVLSDGLSNINNATSLSELEAAKAAAIEAINSAAAIEFPLVEQIDGYTMVSFADYGVRTDEETDFPEQLGLIIPAVAVPFTNGDKISTVTVRLLEALGIDYTCTGNVESGFYLSSIKDFYLADGTYIERLGEFDVGVGSGWMITQNSWFINMGTSEFDAENGDSIKWQFTCRLGSDIGCDWSNGSAKITGINVNGAEYELTPSFSDSTENYYLILKPETEKISIEVLQENYWARASYTVNGISVKTLDNIEVGGNPVIEVNTAFSEFYGGKPTDTDKITVYVYSDGTSAEIVLARISAIERLLSYVSPDDYNNNGKAQLERAIKDGKTAINSAATAEEINAAYTAAIEAIDLVPTLSDAEKTALEALLSEKKKAAAEELGNYVSLDNYRTAQQAEINRIITSGAEKINSSTTLENVDAALREAKAAIDGVKTKQQLTEEESAERISALSGYIETAITARKTNDSLSGSSILGSNEFVESASSTWSDWLAFAMGRYSVTSSDGSTTFLYNDGNGYSDYLKALESYVTKTYSENEGKLSTSKATEWQRAIIAISALGGDPTSFGTYNEKPINLIADGTYNCVVSGGPSRQGINGVIFALIAKNLYPNTTPSDAMYSDDYLVDYILGKQLSDGGWALSGNISDPDITAMAIQALAKYYGRSDVTTAVDTALSTLSEMQQPDGDFKSWGTSNVESTAQVVVALCELGIDPLKNEHFITDSGNNLLDGILKYRLADGGFTHSFVADSANSSAVAGAYNYMATDQAAYALVAYWRLLNGYSSLYTVTYKAPEKTNEEETTDTTAPTKDVGTITFENKTETEIAKEITKAVENLSKDEKNTLTLELGTKTTLSKSIIKSVAGKDVEVKLPMKNAEGVEFEWSFNGVDIGEDFDIEEIDLNLTLSSEKITADMENKYLEENNVTETKPSVKLSLSYDGSFGFTPKLSIKLGNEYASSKATVLYLNEVTNLFELFAEGETDDLGSLSVLFKHASEYLLVFTEAAAIEEEIEPTEEDEIEAVDETEEITADETPDASNENEESAVPRVDDSSERIEDNPEAENVSAENGTDESNAGESNNPPTAVTFTLLPLLISAAVLVRSKKQ